MTIKRAFLVLIAALLLPGLALAQSQGTTRASFTVQKFFVDGNDETPVTINLQCFTGLPLNQSQTVQPDNQSGPGLFEVKFIVQDFVQGELDCNVTETKVTGYDAAYKAATNVGGTASNGAASPIPGAGGQGVGPCKFDNIDTSNADGDNQMACNIYNYPSPVAVSVTKEWVIDGDGGDYLDAHYKLTLHCKDEIVGGKEKNGNWSEVLYKGDKKGTAKTTYTAKVIPDWDDGTACNVEEEVYDSSIDVNNGCEVGLKVAINTPDSCTIVNTVFYEGIPTLSQYGMAILALLMLGVGFVGFRRFV